MVSITREISKYNHSSGNNIQYLVIHDTGCPKTDTAKNNADYFGGGDRQASAHYFVDSNSIYQVVEESQAAWHCGDGHDKYGIGNHNSIGIEMCKSSGLISDATVNNALDLVRSLMGKYHININHVVRHKDASGKNCPSAFSANNWAKWYQFKSRLANIAVVTKPVVPPIRQFPITMTANIENIGIKSTCGNNLCTIGSVGKSLRLEAFSMTIQGIDFTYSCHEQNVGDTGVIGEGGVVGSIGMSRRIESITINVTNIPVGFKLQYRGNVQNKGMTGWLNSGSVCGSQGLGLRLEEIEVCITKS